VVVRRGEEGVYRALQDGLGRAGVVRVIWDRRQGDRRRQQAMELGRERRGRERRSGPAETWRSMGFVMTRLPGAPARP
jgi:hypothetical protein